MIHKFGLVLALAVCLAACGGGDAVDPAPTLSQAPQSQGSDCGNEVEALAGTHVIAVHAGLSYGVDSTATFTATVDTTLSYPAFDPDKRFSLAVGESLTTASGNVVTFVARETVTVPAGTFLACKYEETLADSAPPSMPSAKLTSWVLAGYGISVKSTFVGFLHRREAEATSITVNGQPI